MPVVHVPVFPAGDGSGSVLQDDVEEADGAGFVEGLVAVAALGGLDTRGAPGVAPAGVDEVPRCSPPPCSDLKAAISESRTARMTVIDDHRAPLSVGMQRC